MLRPELRQVPRSRRKFRDQAFTLVELLVVTAVLGLLAGLLLPVLARSQTKARATQCGNNLRQWGLAYRSYADDNLDYLPRRGQGIQVLAQIDRPTDWFNALPGYLGSPSLELLVANQLLPSPRTPSLWLCPAALDPGGAYFLPYGMNMNLCPWSLSDPSKYADITQPLSVVALADAPGPYASTYPSTRPYSAVARHAGRVNLLFLGGQVLAFAGDRVGCGTGDPGLAEVRWLTGTASDATADKY